MDPEFEYSIIMAPGEREIYEGKYDDECSVADFLSHMPVASASALPCQEVFHKEFAGRKNSQWSNFLEVFREEDEDEDEDEYEYWIGREIKHVFWYPSAEAVNNVNPTSKFSASGRSVQEQIKCLLEKLIVDSYVCLVQFWIPKRSSSGRTVLTVSEQPFAMGGIYKGLCRYRYRCIQHEIEVGPIERVFNGRGSTEFCVNIDNYSIQDFPMRNYAKLCGIKQYAAVPISKSDDDQKCIGVMELLAMTDDSGESVLRCINILQSVLEAFTDLTRTPPHARKCNTVRSYLYKYWNMMKSVSSKLGIPLIQIWAPCLCHTATSRGTELFCHLNDHDWSNYILYMTSSFLSDHSVKNGKGLVGRAYSQTKCCFFEDVSRLRVSDNPLVQNASSMKLTACFAIPLQSINPNLHPLILEVFLPPQQNYDHGNLEALLNSILATVFEQQLLLTTGEVLGMTAEELSVKFSNSDDENFVYFSVERISRTTRTSDDEIERSLSLTVKATCRGKTATFPLHNNSEIEELHREVGKRFKLEVGRLDIKYKDEDGEWIVLSCNEDLRFHVDTLKSSDQSTMILEINPSEEGEISLEMITQHREINPIEEGEITLERITQHRGCTTQKEAAEKLGVSLSTLKRRCRGLGLKKWPFSKRKTGARLRKTKVIQECEIGQCSNADAIENEGASANGNYETASHDDEAAVANSTPMGTNGNVLSTGNDGIEPCVTNNSKNSVAAAASSVPMGDIGEDAATGSNMISVMATYKGDTVRFPLFCNSGIEELCKELDDSFQFRAQKFKIRYKYKKDLRKAAIWITLVRDEDLRFRIKELKDSGQSTMELSVFTDSL